MDQLLDIDRSLPVSRHRALPVDVFLPTPSHRSPLSKSNVQTRAIVFPQNFETHTSQFLLLLLILLCSTMRHLSSDAAAPAAEGPASRQTLLHLANPVSPT